MNSSVTVAQRASLSSFDAPLTAAPPKENAEDLNRIIEEEIKVRLLSSSVCAYQCYLVKLTMV